MTAKQIFPVWKDCTLYVNNETATVHEILNSDLSELLQLKTEFVSMTDLCVYITGCINQNISSITIYWHAYSEVIYALTGIIHCEKISIECGIKSTDNNILYEKPKLFLLRENLAPTELRWKSLIKTKTIKSALSPNQNEIFPKIAHKPSILLEIEEAPRFKEMVSCIWKLVAEEAIITSKSENDIVKTCKKLAESQRYTLTNGTVLQNFILVHACLFKLGAVNFWEEMNGKLRQRPELMSKSFTGHEECFYNCYYLCTLLNSIYSYKTLLPEIVDNTRSIHVVVKAYYSEHIDVSYKILSYSTNMMNLFSQYLNFTDLLPYINKHIKIDVSASKQDMIKFLNACLGL